jgi:hypothetical protein
MPLLCNETGVQTPKLKQMMKKWAPHVSEALDRGAGIELEFRGESG